MKCPVCNSNNVKPKTYNPRNIIIGGPTKNTDFYVCGNCGIILD